MSKQLNSIQILGSPNSLNWRTHLFFIAIALINLGVNDVDRLGGLFINWLPVGVIGLLVTILAIELGLRLVPNNSSVIKRATIVILILLIAGVLRGLAIYQSALILELVGPAELLPRLVSAPVFVLISYLVSNAVFTSFLNYKSQQAKLELEFAKLEGMRSSYEADLQTVKAQQIGRVKALLGPPMWELQKKFESAGTESRLQSALIELEAINNQIVRPLSRSLYSESPAQVQSAQIVESKQGKSSGPRRLNISKLQSPALYLLPLFVLGLNGQLLVNPIPQAVATILLGVGILFLTFLIEMKLFQTRELSVLGAFLIANFFAVTGSVSSYLALSSLGLVTESFLAQTFLGVLVIKNLNLVFGSFQADWVKQIGALEEVTKNQEVVNSRLRQQIWLEQRALAMELHGSVQATLQALAMRLSKMERLEPQQISQVLETIQQSLSKIEQLDYLAGRSIDELMQELIDLWEGTAQINYQLPASVNHILVSDRALARCVYEVIREAVTNAVKHGSSTLIDISLATDHQTISIIIANDGFKPQGQSQSLGSEIFSQLCVETSLGEESGRTIFRAKLALSPQV